MYFFQPGWLRIDSRMGWIEVLSRNSQRGRLLFHILDVVWQFRSKSIPCLFGFKEAKRRPKETSAGRQLNRRWWRPAVWCNSRRSCKHGFGRWCSAGDPLVLTSGLGLIQQGVFWALVWRWYDAGVPLVRRWSGFGFWRLLRQPAGTPLDRRSSGSVRICFSI